MIIRMTPSRIEVELDVRAELAKKGTLVLEGETRFDAFPTHSELYRIDVASDRAQWLDFPVSDYA